jgi:DDE family transposase
LKRLVGLLAEDTAGDPMGRRRLWTGKRLRQITAELAHLDIQVCPNTVRRLLHQLGYGLHANAKTLSVDCLQRDEQFTYMAEEKEQFRKRGLPIISVDTKKKELIGNFKNVGRVWSQQATPVNDHDFRSQGIGMAIPFGVYDPVRNRGSVFVGTSHDTPQFAAENIARWWRSSGQKDYPRASHLLILADSGGSNGARVRMWKWALQKEVANRFGLEVTVCHFPTGASKWNPIEHRLFSEISKHWAGQPLNSYSAMLSLIGSTTTQTGLCVRSQLITKCYPTDRKVSDPQMQTINLDSHSLLPVWNYTISPNENRN